MKYSAIILSLLLTAFSSVSAQINEGAVQPAESPRLKLTGKVEQISITTINPNKNTKIHKAEIKINFTLENQSSENLIFIEPMLTLRKLSIHELYENGEYSKPLADDSFYSGKRSSFWLNEEEWKKIQQDLNKSSPPPIKTRVLAVGKRINFEEIVYLDLPENDYSRGIFTENSRLPFLKEIAPLFIKTSGETWETLAIIIDGKVNQTKKSNFGSELRKRWRKSGYLWLDKIVSEPISIDFNSAVPQK